MEVDAQLLMGELLEDPNAPTTQERDVQYLLAQFVQSLLREQQNVESYFSPTSTQEPVKAGPG